MNETHVRALKLTLLRTALAAGLGCLGCDGTVVVGAAPAAQPLASASEHFSWFTTLNAAAPAEARSVARFPDGQGVAVIGFSTERDASGRPHKDIFIAVLDDAGRTSWSQTLDFAGKDDEGFDLIVTAQHELIGGGFVTDVDGVVRAWLGKWSPTGEVLATSVSEPEQMLKVKALGLLELEGNVIAAGYANTFERGRDIVVEKRSVSTLLLDWSYRFNGPLSGEDEPHRVAIWRSSPIWVAGYIQTEIAAGSELSLLELSPKGDFSWQRSLVDAQGLPLAGEARGLAVNDIDNVYYLCGTLFDDNAAPSTAAVFQLGYRGDELWQRRYPDAGDEAAVAIASACALGGDALTLVGSQTTENREQLWASKYDPAGARLWLRRLPELKSGLGVAAQADGGVLLTGQTRANQAYIGRMVP
jgi:hypothetical protein